MIKIEGKTYVFNLDAISDFVNVSTNTESKEREIISTFAEGNADEKSVRELTTPGNPQIDNIRYDMLKMFILQILTYDEKDITDITQMPFGTQLAFLTLINEEFLILVEDTEE